MDSASPSYDDERPQNTYSLELAYHESIQKSQLILNDENSRRMRLQILLLEDDKDQLYEQLARRDDVIETKEREVANMVHRLRESEAEAQRGAVISKAEEEVAERNDAIERKEREIADMMRRLEQFEVEVQKWEADSRSKAREIHSLKTKIKSLEDESKDSAKLLAEKLSLERELKTLKPELEHLRAQASQQQTKRVLSDSRKERLNTQIRPEKSAPMSVLDKVAEEGFDENKDPRPLLVNMGSIKPTTVSIEDLEPKKKKRKVLGGAKTIFDEDEGEGLKRPMKLSLASARPLGKKVAGRDKAVPPGILGAAAVTLGAFSPLKKDRRGPNASFLAR